MLFELPTYGDAEGGVGIGVGVGVGIDDQNTRRETADVGWELRVDGVVEDTAFLGDRFSVGNIGVASNAELVR
jgi:hypothetical protein